MSSKSSVEIVNKLVSKYAPDLALSLFEIGARQLTEDEELFYGLLDVFPKSRLSSFEVDKVECDKLNEKSRPNVTYYPTALGYQDGEQMFYETMAPMCSSLYKPNESLLAKYNELDVAKLRAEYPVKVISLDSFTKSQKIDVIDFVKIDVQGAELDIFKGGVNALANTLFIVTEVEFIPIYTDQPLFGDISQYLAEKGFMLHSLFNFGSRSLKPVVIQNNPYTGSQMLWADAIFIRDISKLDSLAADSLLKLGLLAFMYGSSDLTYHCFELYDAKQGTDLHLAFSRLGNRQ